MILHPGGGSTSPTGTSLKVFRVTSRTVTTGEHEGKGVTKVGVSQIRLRDGRSRVGVDLSSCRSGHP